MDINKYLVKENISTYQLSKRSEIPYSTLRDILVGKVSIKKCSAETVLKLSQALHLTMEELMADEYQLSPLQYEQYKHGIRHQVKELGDLVFIKSVMINHEIESQFNQNNNREACYLLAMVDYLSRIHHLKWNADYEPYRQFKLKELSVPSSIMLAQRLNPTENYIQEGIQKSIPEFMRHNIVEIEVDDLA